MCEYFASMYICAPVVLSEAREVSHMILGTRVIDSCEPSCGWVLGIETRSSARAAIGLCCFVEIVLLCGLGWSGTHSSACLCFLAMGLKMWAPWPS